MLLEEFNNLTGFYPDAALYAAIEDRYSKWDGDKQSFCKAYAKNKDGMADAIARKVTIDHIIAEEKQSKAAATEFEKLHTEIASLKAALEREQEWKAIEDEHNVKQADYEKLESDKFTKVLTDEEAASLIADEFGFVESKVKIIHEIDKEEVNRHGQCRRNGKFVRKALFNAWDWNYIRFNVCGMAYEMHDGELKLFWH